MLSLSWYHSWCACQYKLIIEILRYIDVHVHMNLFSRAKYTISVIPTMYLTMLTLTSSFMMEKMKIGKVLVCSLQNSGQGGTVQTLYFSTLHFMEWCYLANSKTKILTAFMGAVLSARNEPIDKKIQFTDPINPDPICSLIGRYIGCHRYWSYPTSLTFSHETFAQAKCNSKS